VQVFGERSTPLQAKQELNEAGELSNLTQFATQTEKRRAIREAIEADPDASNRAIARQLDVDKNTVGNVRQTVEEPGDPVPTGEVARSGVRSPPGVVTAAPRGLAGEGTLTAVRYDLLAG
jgi:hypothetical protein